MASEAPVSATAGREEMTSGAAAPASVIGGSSTARSGSTWAGAAPLPRSLTATSIEQAISTAMAALMPASMAALRLMPSSTVTAVSCAVTTEWQKFRVQGTTVAGTSSMQVYVGGNSSFSTGEAVYAWDAELLAGSGIIYDSGWVDVWPSGMIPLSLLEWEDDNYWLGTLSQSAIAGYQAPFIHLLSTAQTLRYWRVEIGDTVNPDAYVQIGRLFMAATWVPSVNYAYGAGLGFEDPTPVDTALSGAEYFDVRSRFRVFNFELEYLLATEAYNSVLDLQRLAGASGEVLVVPNRDDTTTQPSRAFLGRLRQMSQVREVQPSAFTVAFEAKELI